MTAGSRLRIAATTMALAWAGAAAPLAAQDVAPANNSAETVGPPQLRDFSIGGTVTRRPDAPAPSTTTTTTTTTTRPVIRPPATASAPAATARPDAPRPAGEEPSAPPPASAPSMELPDAPSSSQPTAVQASPGPSLGSQPGVVPPSLPSSSGIPVEGGPSLLPWLLGALLLGAGALYYALRPRRRVALAGPDVEQARPLERAPAPEPAPAPPQSAPTGIVSTRLRPWLEIEFVPERLIFDGQAATIRFDVTIRNSGTATARDVLVEGAMFNAGTAQDEEIGAFFAHPVGKGERLAEIHPLRSVALRSAISMPVEQMRVFNVEGRKLFVPLVGLNTLYRWGGGEGQTSASYLIGRDANAERMGPFFLDLGPRVFRTIAARQHLLKVRK